MINSCIIAHIGKQKNNKSKHIIGQTVSILLSLLVVLLLQSCSTIDDFFTGEDNSKPPTELEEINQVVSLSTQWSKDVGAGNDEAFVRLYPAISGTTISLIDRDGMLSGLDRFSGKILWQKDLEMTITGGLGVTDNFLFTSNDNAELIALDIETGEQLWKKTLSSISLSKPLVSGDVLVVRTLDGKLYGLLKENAEQIWIYDRGVPVLTFRGNSSPVIGGEELVFTGFDSGKVAAIGLQHGRLLWETTAAVPRGRSDIERMVDIDGDPILVGRSLFVVTINGRVVSIDAITGKLNWARDISSFVGMGVDKRNIYITDSDNNIWAFGQKNGEILWKQDKLKYRQLTSPTIIGKNLLVSDFEGYVHVLSTIDGELIGRKQFDSEGYLVSPVVYKDDIYLYGNSGSITSIKLTQ
ncbi:MAG: outer membrane protein assembly factor BamB [Pseudomonadota bacterium]